MSVTLGAGWSPKTPLPQRDPLNAMDELLIAITLLRDAVLSQSAPVVNVEPQDLSDIVQAVQGLAGPHSDLTVQDITDAVREVITGAEPSEQEPEWVEKLLEALEKLDFRLKGVGGNAGGFGGSSNMSVQNVTGTTLGVTVSGPLQSQILDSGNTTVRTSAHGAAQYVGAWSLTRSLGVQRCLTVLASTVSSGLGGTFEFQFSEDGSTATIDETRTVTSFSSVREFDLENFGAYYRVKWTPSRALVGSEMVFISTQFATQDPGRFVRLANQQVEEQNAALPQNLTFLQGFDDGGLSQNFRAKLASDQVDGNDYALLVKNLPTGEQPDGDFVNARADGTVFTDTTVFAASATRTFTSTETTAAGWFDSDGFATIEIVVATDQISAANGIIVEFSDDVEIAVPIVRATELFTFGASDVTRGYLKIVRAVGLDGFRIRYMNGGTLQGSFFIQANVRVSPSGPPLNSLESNIDATSTAQMGRNAIFGKDPASGTYGLMTRSPVDASSRTGIHVAVMGHTTPTPIKPDTGITGSAGTITATPAKIIDITAVPAGATSVEIQAQKGNNQVILGATSSGTATSSNAFFELDAGQTKYLSIGTGLTTDVWLASASGSQGYRLCWTFGGAS